LLLENVSLVINPGESVAISGSNGAGKSTLISILAGFTDPNQGQYCFDDRPVGDYDIEFLRSQIGIVPQRGVLFEGSILENMTLYREGEAKAEALELANFLGLDTIISRLPNGLDTQVGGSAVDTLSEGVRQKIIMVRALVGHPRVILFDDSNANFDIRDDNRLLELIQHLKGDRTMVMVSHRPMFQRLCDRHFVLANGNLHLYGNQTQQEHKLDNEQPQPVEIIPGAQQPDVSPLLEAHG
jgi:ATP-binding cassette subfamily C protein LapB